LGDVVIVGDVVILGDHKGRPYGDFQYGVEMVGHNHIFV